MRTKLMRVARIFRVFTECANDAWLFLRHNGLSPFEARDRRLAHKTIIEAHTIEKGLALPVPRPHFGRDKIMALLDMNASWNPPVGDLSRSMLLGALRDYRTTFADVPSPDPRLAARVDAFLDNSETASACGGLRMDVDGLVKRDDLAIDFLERRFSARDFGPQPLDDAQIYAVVSLAQRAPSQCNRQSVRVHVYRNRTRIAQLLELQGGARGFIEAVPTLFVVTSEITAWGGPQQRNQLYVDGGIYAMMMLLALDAHGFVSCPLNLAITNRTERAIKAAGTIPARERLVVMITAGPPPNKPLRAACSPRYSAEAIARVHD